MQTSAVQEAPVLEVFASIQGEGAYAGEPQVFLRLAGCPLRCVWCDTPHSWSLAPRADGEPGWHGGATPFQVACRIAELEQGRLRPLSVTGGEPLMWPDFLLALARLCGERRLHLETAGGHPRTLARVLDVVDHVSLDLKLAEDMSPPVPLPVEGLESSPVDAAGWAAARQASLELIAQRDACAKIVVSGGRTVRQYDELLDELERFAPQLPLFLQPVTPVRGCEPAEPEGLRELTERALERGLAVRVVPQLHPVLGVR